MFVAGQLIEEIESNIKLQAQSNCKQTNDFHNVTLDRDSFKKNFIYNLKKSLYICTNNNL